MRSDKHSGLEAFASTRWIFADELHARSASDDREDLCSKLHSVATLLRFSPSSDSDYPRIPQGSCYAAAENLRSCKSQASILHLTSAPAGIDQKLPDIPALDAEIIGRLGMSGPSENASPAQHQIGRVFTLLSVASANHPKHQWNREAKIP